MIAKCQSFRCNEKPVQNKQGVVKDVHISKTNCPDCGHILLWHTDKQRVLRGKRKKTRIYLQE